MIKAVTVVGTTLFVTLNVGANPASAEVKKEIKDILKKNPEKEIVVQATTPQSTEKMAKYEALGDTTSALSFAVNNVDKYYPDMKDHLNWMINQFGRNTERKNAVDSIFSQTIMEIADPIQRIWAIIYALEGYIFRESEFSKKYDSNITDETFLIMENAKDQYNNRVKERKANIAKIDVELEKINKELEKNKQTLENNQQTLETNKKTLENNKQELDNILYKVTAKDIKEKEWIKNLVIKTKALYIKYEFKANKHIDELFKLVP